MANSLHSFAVCSLVQSTKLFSFITAVVVVCCSHLEQNFHIDDKDEVLCFLEEFLHHYIEA